jgi:hypothetical protein
MAGEMDLLGDRIVEQAAHIDAAMQRLLADIRTFDASGAWASKGMQSCAHWLSWRVGWGLAMARDRVRVARGLGEFPATEACLGRGELSYSRVRAVLRVATPATESILLEVARHSTAEQMETVARKYAGVQAHDKESTPSEDRDRRQVQRRATADGAGVVEVTEDEHGAPLSVGRKRRTIPGSIRRALWKQDSACTFPGCTNHVFLEGHHIRHWAEGGETSLENLVMLCSHHHRFVHEYGYAIEMGREGHPQFRDPDGRLAVAVPERPVPADLGWPAIRAANAGLDIDASTPPCWDGTRISYHRVVDGLAFADGVR